MASVPEHIEAFWRRFLESPRCPPDAAEWFYESFRIGSSPGDAARGAELILSGRKTATSSLLWEYEDRGRPLPQAGALSVVEDGDGNPVCVVRTTWVDVIAFGEVDARFARDYGEGDGTLDGWKRRFWRHYAAACEARGWKMSEETPLVCERFRLLFA